MSKIYISGKITGIEDEAEYNFNRGENHVISLGKTPVNPMTIEHDHDKSWHSYMKSDIKALCDCEGIYMLNNWTDSKGAIIEHTIAMYLGLDVTYEPKS